MSHLDIRRENVLLLPSYSLQVTYKQQGVKMCSRPPLLSISLQRSAQLYKCKCFKQSNMFASHVSASHYVDKSEIYAMTNTLVILVLMLSRSM